MQTAAHNIIEIADAPPKEPVRPSLAAGRRWTTALAGFSRFGAVLFPVTAVQAIYSAGVDGPFLAAIGLATTVWFLALRRAYAATRPSTFALGIPLTSALGTLVGLAAVTVVSSLLPALRLAHQEVILMSLVVLLASVSLETIVAHSGVSRRRVLIVGTTEGGAKLAEHLRRSRSPFVCIGVAGEDSEAAALAGMPGLNWIAELPEIVGRDRPDLVVLAGAQPRAAAVDCLLDSPWPGFRILDLPQFYEHAFGFVPVEHLSATWFMSVLHLYHRPSSQWSKRAFDLTFAAVGLLLGSALFIILGWLVHRSGPGPVVLRQIRLGKGGRPFEILKFRTMVDGAEGPGAALWAEVNDPRVTRVGRMMRRSRLDELPQLWNVLMGEMSLIGPRPERPEFLALLQHEIPFWTRRHLVKPGITGWAQVRGGYASDSLGMATKLSHDFYYLKHRSLLLDLAILAKTAKIVLSGSGAR